MSRVTALVLSIFVSVQAFGAEVWVTFSQLSSREKLEKLAEQRRQQLKEADFISSFDAFLAHPVSESVLNSIFKIEEQAQDSATNGQFKKSLVFYKKLQMKLENIPNVSGIERITFSTFIHLAELHDLLNDGEGPRFWREAQGWDNRLLKTSAEFSPKLTTKFNSLKFHSATAALEIVSPLESAVYVDGRKVPLIDGRFRKTLALGYHHVDVLVPSSEWVSKSVELKANQEMTFRPEPLVEGTCETPHFIGSPLPPQTKLLVNFGTCDRIYFEKNWFNIEGRQLESLAPGPQVSDVAVAEMPAETPKLLERNEGKSWMTEAIHSKWLWIGAGVVAASIALLSTQNQPTVTPTNTFK